MTDQPTPPPLDAFDRMVLIDSRDRIEASLARRPLTVGQVWATNARLAELDRQLDAQ